MLNYSLRFLVFPLLLIIAPVLTLTACDAIRISSEPVTELLAPHANPPDALAERCEDPVDLPDGPLSAGAVERLWGKDVNSLVLCRDRKDALLDWYKHRDAGLAGK